MPTLETLPGSEGGHIYAVVAKHKGMVLGMRVEGLLPVHSYVAFVVRLRVQFAADAPIDLDAAKSAFGFEMSKGSTKTNASTQLFIPLGSLMLSRMEVRRVWHKIKAAEEIVSSVIATVLAAKGKSTDPHALSDASLLAEWIQHAFDNLLPEVILQEAAKVALIDKITVMKNPEAALKSLESVMKANITPPPAPAK